MPELDESDLDLTMVKNRANVVAILQYQCKDYAFTGINITESLNLSLQNKVEGTKRHTKRYDVCMNTTSTASTISKLLSL